MIGKHAWTAYQMGGEQALGRVALLASDDPDSRVRLAALRTILEQTGKLKTLPSSLDVVVVPLMIFPRRRPTLSY